MNQKLQPLALCLLVSAWPAAAAAGLIVGMIKSDKGKAVSRVRVKAWDKDPNGRKELLGQAITNRRGYYKIRYRDKHWDGLKKNQRFTGNKAVSFANPDVMITVEVYARKRWETIARSRVYRDTDMRKTLHIDLDRVRKKDAYTRRTIYGVIRDHRGRRLRGLTVFAWDKDWGDNVELMGKSRTNRYGRYRIVYRPKRWDGLKHGPSLGVTANPDIFITVVNTRDNRFLGRSIVYKDHPPNEKLNIDLRLAKIHK